MNRVLHCPECFNIIPIQMGAKIPHAWCPSCKIHIKFHNHKPIEEVGFTEEEANESIRPKSTQPIEEKISPKGGSSNERGDPEGKPPYQRAGEKPQRGIRGTLDEFLKALK